MFTILLNNLPSIALLAIGTYCGVTGVLTLINRSQDISQDSAFSKKHLSPYTRYWIGRYYAGFAGIGAALAFFALAAILYLAH
jgi:hypothetical protein